MLQALPPRNLILIFFVVQIRIFFEIIFDDCIGINYNDYSWNSFKDGIAWATDNDAISVNYKQGGCTRTSSSLASTPICPS